VPPIGYLDCVGRGFRCRFSVQTGSITTDDLGSRMSLEPLRSALRAAIRKQIDDLATFKVTENRAIAASLAPCPIVDAKHAWRLRGDHHSFAPQLP
jgi:hypothetical protein